MLFEQEKHEDSLARQSAVRLNRKPRTQPLIRRFRGEMGMATLLKAREGEVGERPPITALTSAPLTLP